MAKILTIVDDLTGAQGASERWVAISDGKKVYRLQIDLVDRNYSSMEKAFKDALSRWLVNGEVSVVKVADLPQAIEGPKDAETIVSDADLFAETEAPKPAPKPEPTPKPTPKPKAKTNATGRRPSVAHEVPPASQRPKGADGEPFSPYLMKALKRPGITTWWKRNAGLLQLDPYRSGRVPVTVEAAFDRYQGQDVTQDGLHPTDLERLTTPSNGNPNP